MLEMATYWQMRSTWIENKWNIWQGFSYILPHILLFVYGILIWYSHIVCCFDTDFCLNYYCQCFFGPKLCVNTLFIAILIDIWGVLADAWVGLGIELRFWHSRTLVWDVIELLVGRHPHSDFFWDWVSEKSLALSTPAYVTTSVSTSILPS